MSFSRARTWISLVALATTVAVPAGAITPTTGLMSPSGASAVSVAPEPGGRADRATTPAVVLAAFAKTHKLLVPAFSRQTGLACSSCHYQFLQLTPFGRLFKLNGYTLTGIPTVGSPGEQPGHETLKLLSIPPVAAMVVGSFTQINKTLPETQNGTVGFPQELSVFLAGQITPHVGTFTQFTYAAADGSFGVDNVDIRFANKGTLGDREMIYGVTLHNNPTVQDVWNTVPAWGYPFMAPESAPSPIASTLIDEALGQQVLGLGAYSLFANVLYTEFTAYRSALQGTEVPLGASATNVTSGVIPYWRVALQHETPATSLMLGTFGFVAHVFPTGVSGATNNYTDIAVDGQVEQRVGAATWIGRATYIHEKEDLNAALLAGTAAQADHTVWTARANIAYLPNLKYSFTLGYFQTSGSSDPVLYAPAPVTGSNSGGPNTSGIIGEFNYNAWQNTRLGLQYTAYTHFNGSTDNYDVPGGRSASNNNTLYLYTWLAF